MQSETVSDPDIPANPFLAPLNMTELDGPSFEGTEQEDYFEEPSLDPNFLFHSANSDAER